MTLFGLTVSTEDLQATGAAVRAVAIELDRAGVRSGRTAAHVGHEGLATCLEQFAVGWEGTRSKLIDDIARLGDACTAVGAEFEAIDTALAASLKGQP